MKLKTRQDGVQAFLRRSDVSKLSASVDWADRLAYAHDTSFRSMRLAGSVDASCVPDAVIWPSDTDEVIRLMRAAVAENVPLIPWGGGSGIVGGALAVCGGVTVDFKQMNRILHVDRTSHMARVQPGIVMQILENQLNDIGFTCAHYPQSMNSATLGGAIAHRGAGFKSTRYGKIEDLVLGLEAAVPPGEILRLKAIARHSNGPDLRHLLIGSEGTLGFVTEATIKLYPLPEASLWQSFLFDTFEDGLSALRSMMQSGVLPAVVRLFDEPETEVVFRTTFPKAKGALLIVLWEGLSSVERIEPVIFARCSADHGGRPLGSEPGEWWWERRVSTASFLRTQHQGDFAETIEVAASWSQALKVYRTMLKDMRAVLGSQGVVFGHVAHAYPTGPDIYMVIQGKALPGRTLEDSHAAVIRAAVSAALGAGATLSHHHGIGTLRREFLEQELGPAGFRLLKGLAVLFDEKAVLNPGKLGKA